MATDICKSRIYFNFRSYFIFITKYYYLCLWL